jgi:hypothetical protein
MISGWKRKKSIRSAFAWEASNDARSRHVTGDVVKVEQVLAGKGGDSKEFTVRYTMQGKNYYLVARRGILDSLGSLRNLQRGDRVPLVVSAGPPVKAGFDTLSGRYPITLCFVALSAVFLAVMIIPLLTGSRSPPQS